MRCQVCEAEDTRVVDSRPVDGNVAIRRRRACASCGHRFTTFERCEIVELTVVKRGGGREPFDREKILSGVRAAAKGRPLTDEAIDCLADTVEDQARLVGAEVAADEIGRLVLARLRSLDEVAAVRFASVYKGFEGVADFEREMALIKADQPQPS